MPTVCCRTSMKYYLNSWFTFRYWSMLLDIKHVDILAFHSVCAPLVPSQAQWITLKPEENGIPMLCESTDTPALSQWMLVVICRWSSSSSYGGIRLKPPKWGLALPNYVIILCLVKYQRRNCVPRTMVEILPPIYLCEVGRGATRGAFVFAETSPKRIIISFSSPYPRMNADDWTRTHRSTYFTSRKICEL